MSSVTKTFLNYNNSMLSWYRTQREVLMTHSCVNGAVLWPVRFKHRLRKWNKMSEYFWQRQKQLNDCLPYWSWFCGRLPSDSSSLCQYEGCSGVGRAYQLLNMLHERVLLLCCQPSEHHCTHNTWHTTRHKKANINSRRKKLAHFPKNTTSV